MVQLALEKNFVHTALDLEEGLERLTELTRDVHGVASSAGRPSSE